MPGDARDDGAWEAQATRAGTWDLMLDRRPWRLDLPDLEAVDQAVRDARRARGRDGARVTVIGPSGDRDVREVPA